MDLSPAIFSAITAVLSVPLFMALMRRIGSLRHEPQGHRRFAELRREYARWELLSIPLSIGFVAALTLPIWMLLRWLYRLQLARLDGSDFVVGLADSAWLPPALLLALFLSALPFHFLFLALLGQRRYAEYTEFSNRKFRLDTWKLFRYLANLAIPLCLLATLLALDCYARFTRDAIVVNRFLGIGEQSYPIGGLRRVELVGHPVTATDGDNRRAYFAFYFTGGDRFSFRDPFADTPLVVQREIATRVARLAGVRISLADETATAEVSQRD